MYRSTIGVFLLFFSILLWLYHGTFGAGLVTDQIGWLMTYEEYGWRGLLCAFNDKSLHLVYHWLGFGLWKMFGWNGVGWGICFVALHALVATLGFNFFRQLFFVLKVAKPTLIALLGSLVFLLSPYHTEPLVWYACVHYLFCGAILLLALQQFLHYTQNHRTLFVVGFYALYTLAVFTLEISFTLPLILGGLILLLPETETHRNRVHLLLTFVLPSLMIVALYFFLNFLLRGNAAGHYGAATHFNFSIPLLMSNLSKYTFKIFGFTQFLPYEKRQLLYHFFEQPTYAYLLFGALLSIAVFTLWKLGRLPKYLRVLIFLVAGFVLALAPIVNLFFSSIVNVEGDRLSYWSSVFSSQLVSFALLSLLSYVGIAVVAVYLFFSLQFLSLNTQAWAMNKAVQQGLLQSFSAENTGHIYLLNLPDNYNGTYMYRSFAPDNSFAETLWLRHQKDIRHKVTQVLAYNMTQQTDGVSVNRINEKTLQVTFNQWGNWWWQDGIGAANYNTEDYTVVIDEWSHSYTITFREKKPNAVYLYQIGDRWEKVVDF